MNRRVPLVVLLCALLLVAVGHGRTHAQEPTPESTAEPTGTPALSLSQSFTLLDSPIPETAVPGSTIQFTIRVQNSGTLSAQNVSVTSRFDDALAERIASVSAGSTITGPEITWQLGELAPEAEQTVSYALTLKRRLPAGTESFSTQAGAQADDVTPVTADPAVISIALPSLTLQKTVVEIVGDQNGNGRADPGDTVRYNLIYTNVGQAPANNVILVDDYPEGDVASVDNISNGGEDNGRTITWRLSAVPPASQDTLSYDVRLKAKYPSSSASIENQARLSSDETGTVTAQSALALALPQLSISKERELIGDLNNNAKVDPGDTLRYRITYVNRGTSSATDVVVRDDYPAELLAVIQNISENGRDNGSVILWVLDEVPAQAQGTLTYEATVRSNLRPGSFNLRNQVALSSNEQDEISAESQVQIEVAATPTAVPTATVAPTATAVPPTGPQSGIFANTPTAPIVLIGVLAIGAMLGFIYVGAWSKLGGPNSGEDEHTKQTRLWVVREGIFLVFIVSSILILAIGRGVESDGAISILSAIVGYVFGRAVSNVQT